MLSLLAEVANSSLEQEDEERYHFWVVGRLDEGFLGNNWRG